MYNIKQRQIQYANKYHKERSNIIELLQKTGIKLSKTEIENILIFGDIRGPYFLTSIASDDTLATSPEEFSDLEILKELLEFPSDLEILKELKS